jgi:hypothetical protein
MESEWLLVRPPRQPFLDLCEEHLERYRVLSYIDDIFICPSLGRRSTEEDCVKAGRVLDSLLERYGLTRHPTKGIWGRGSQCVSLLGFVVGTKPGVFGVPAHKLESVSEGPRKLLARAKINRRRHPAKELEVFIGKLRASGWLARNRVPPSSTLHIPAEEGRACGPERGAGRVDGLSQLEVPT